MADSVCKGDIVGTESRTGLRGSERRKVGGGMWEDED